MTDKYMKKFAKVWNKSNNPQEAADRLGLTYWAATRRASIIRHSDNDSELNLKYFYRSHEHYHEIGKKGGSVSHPETRAFYRDRDLARRAGKIGGTISRKTKGAKSNEKV